MFCLCLCFVFVCSKGSQTGCNMGCTILSGLIYLFFWELCCLQFYSDQVCLSGSYLSWTPSLVFQWRCFAILDWCLICSNSCLWLLWHLAGCYCMSERMVSWLLVFWLYISKVLLWVFQKLCWFAGWCCFSCILCILAFRSGYHWTVWIQDRYFKFFVIAVLVHTECSSSDGRGVQIGNEDMDVYQLVLYTILLPISYQDLCRWSDQGSLPLFFKYCSRILCGDELCWFPLEIFLVPYIYIYNGFIKHCDLIKRLGISIQNIALY